MPSIFGWQSGGEPEHILYSLTPEGRLIAAVLRKASPSIHDCWCASMKQRQSRHIVTDSWGRENSEMQNEVCATAHEQEGDLGLI